LWDLSLASLRSRVFRNDLNLANEMILPLYLYSIIEDQWNEFIPKDYILPLEGLPFIWGQFDCYEMIRIYLRQNCNVYIGDYPRDETFPDTGATIILDNFSKEGIL